MIQKLNAVSADERFVIHGVDWETYEKFLDAVGDRHVFLTYDGSNLEFMSSSLQREVWAIWLTLLIRLLAAERNLPIRCLGRATWKNQRVRRALEADVSIYVQNVPVILGKMEIDLRRDPPPDLMVEIDVSPSHLDRQRIYSRLGVPEVWKFDGASLRVYCLGPRRAYQLQQRNPTFPELELSAIPKLFHEFSPRDDTTNLRALRRWVRRQGGAPKSARVVNRKAAPSLS